MVTGRGDVQVARRVKGHPGGLIQPRPGPDERAEKITVRIIILDGIGAGTRDIPTAHAVKRQAAGCDQIARDAVDKHVAEFTGSAAKPQDAVVVKIDHVQIAIRAEGHGIGAVHSLMAGKRFDKPAGGAIVLADTLTAGITDV